MATILQLRRGTTVQHSTFTGAVGEVTVDTTKDTVVVHDGTTAGGKPLATEAYVTSQLATADNTDEITEGSTNLYFTNARARGAVSVTDSGGDGSLSYNNSTGVFTFTGPSASDVRAHFSASTGISITNGAISTSITQYTDALARASISVTDNGGDGSLSYNNSTGVLSFTGPSASDVRAHFSAGTGITITNGAVAVDSTIASKTYADNAATTAVAAVIDSSPAALNTLNELAAALGDDANFATTVTTSIGTKLDSSAVSAFGLTLIDDASAAAARTTLGLGTAATTASSAYATSAQGTKADNALPAANVSAFGLTLIDDASAGAARTTLGLGTMATRAASNYVAIEDVTVTGAALIAAASAAAARTTLGLGTAATTAAADYATAAQGTLATNALPAASYTAADVLTKIKTVDGAGSGLDADLLDGQSSAYFRINVYDAAGTLLN